MRLSHARRPKKKNVLGLANKVAGGQVENLFAVNGWIKAPIKVFQRFQAAEISGFGAAFNLALIIGVLDRVAATHSPLGPRLQSDKAAHKPDSCRQPS